MENPDKPGFIPASDVSEKVSSYKLAHVLVFENEWS